MNRKVWCIWSVILALVVAESVDAGLFSFLRGRRGRVVAVPPAQRPTPQASVDADPIEEKDVPVDVPEMARREILRRGNAVERVGSGWAASLISQVMGPPPDDSHKWFVSVIVKSDCSACERLLRDFASSPFLRAYVDVQDHSRSWAHFNVFRANDETQSWRWKDIRIAGYPTLIVQPPRNGAYGDPHTVVMQKTGYDGDPEALATSLRDAILRYVQAARARRVPQSGMRQPAAADESEPPPARYEPPFEPPPTPPAISPAPEQPTVPFDIPPQPTAVPSINPVALLLSALGALLGGSTLTNILLLVLAVMIGVREFRKATGQKLLLDDEAFARIVAEIKAIVRNKDDGNRDGASAGS